MTQRQPADPDGGRRRGGDVDGLRRDTDRLAALVAELPVDVAGDGRRDLRALDSASGLAELHLRALGALLVSLDTWVRGHRPTTGRAGPAAVPAAGDAGTVGVDAALAAAAARYIARDLAARRLSEFTSAEGYRLARALAAIGGVGADVEDLLADANTVRLHPMPLAEAVSHSSAG